MRGGNAIQTRDPPRWRITARPSGSTRMRSKWTAFSLSTRSVSAARRSARRRPGRHPVEPGTRFPQLDDPPPASGHAAGGRRAPARCCDLERVGAAEHPSVLGHAQTKRLAAGRDNPRRERIGAAHVVVPGPPEELDRLVECANCPRCALDPRTVAPCRQSCRPAATDASRYSRSSQSVTASMKRRNSFRLIAVNA